MRVLLFLVSACALSVPRRTVVLSRAAGRAHLTILSAGTDDAEKPNQYLLGARNIGFGVLALLPEFFLRIPAYNTCVSEKGRDACANLLPFFDWLYHKGFPFV